MHNSIRKDIKLDRKDLKNKNKNNNCVIVDIYINRYYEN